MGEYVECDRDQPFSKIPKLEDKKTEIGGGGQIKVKYKAAIEGYDANANDMAKMEALGLPTGFASAPPKTDNSPNLIQKKNLLVQHLHVGTEQ